MSSKKRGRPAGIRVPAVAPVSKRLRKSAFARYMGCSASQVSQWISAGRIPATAVGSDDFVEVQQAVEALKAAGLLLARGEAANLPLKAAEAPPIGKPDGSLSLDEAQRLDANLKAYQRALEVKRQRGEVVDRAQAERLFFEAARSLRDSFIGWPARVAATLAAEADADPAKLLRAMEREVKAHLAGVAPPIWRP